MKRLLKLCFYLVLLMLLLSDLPFTARSQQSPVPAPAPAPASQPSQEPPKGTTPPPGGKSKDWRSGGGSSGGLIGGQKAGIAFGVIAGAGIIGFAGFIYKKRRPNIRRARFGPAARRAQL